MISYRVELFRPEAHLYRVNLSIPDPSPGQRVGLPVWIPGSYLVREFARHLSSLQATQGGRAVGVRQLDKANWQVDCTADGALELVYLVYAYDSSVRAAWLDRGRGFFNGTSLFLRVDGCEQQPHEMVLRELPKGWQVATAMRPAKIDARGRGRYLADDYDELVDHPVELGDFWRGHFVAHGIEHEFVVRGALPDFDGERLLQETQRICEAEIEFWHADRKPPFQRYLFLLNAVEDGYGGLEHRASTALIANRRDLPQRGRAAASEGHVKLLGLISHEYFHTWNVKRLRPAEFERYDYRSENYTELLWFFEGFTSYYDDLLLLRSGLIDRATYMRLVGKTIGGVLAAPGRKLQSVAQSSFDAWVKYYRQDENTPNATISYYTKGALVALAIDLTLRSEKRGSLDQVMRALWQRSTGGPISEADIAQALQQVSGRSFAEELAAWVHGTDDLPLLELLERFGITMQHEAATLAERLGLKVSESALTGVRLTQVWRGGVGEASGLAPGDELLGVDDWRLRRLDDALRLLSPGQSGQWLVSRDQRLLRLPFVMPDESAAAPAAVKLDAQTSPAKPAAALQKAWLAG
ncbi:M61 family metallopeptidase [Piscinibacter sakaiensis]|uniref:M61 family metallopeptidase n=1 Tax=Piscinibacter sakaiensis TaxID=1547922 RepID=UPI003AAAA66F